MYFRKISQSVGVFLICCMQFFNVTYANDVVVPEKKITIEKHIVYYNDTGIGTPIVLVHGLFANKEQWNSFTAILAQHGYRVIDFDLPGYGKSLGFPFKDYELTAQVNL